MMRDLLETAEISGVLGASHPSWSWAQTLGHVSGGLAAGSFSHACPPPLSMAGEGILSYTDLWSEIMWPLYCSHASSSASLASVNVSWLCSLGEVSLLCNTPSSAPTPDLPPNTREGAAPGHDESTRQTRAGHFTARGECPAVKL